MADRRLMMAFAHPDDESHLAGSTTARYAAEGAEVVVVITTRGEAGEIAPGVDATPENDDPRAFVQAPESQVVGELVNLMRKHRPQVVVTFDESGGYGHPDHVFISKTTTIAFKESGNANFESPGGLEPWSPLKLYYMAFPRSRIKRFVEEYRKMKPDNEISEIDPETLGVPDEMFTTQLEVAQYVPVRREAAAQHRSQGSPFDMFPEAMHEDVFSIDHLILVDPSPAPGLSETDLFEGI